MDSRKAIHTHFNMYLDKSDLSQKDINGIKYLLISLEDYYPSFESWLNNKVIDDLENPSTIIVTSKEGDVITGVSIGKKGLETKLRCVRVHPEFRQSGLGLRLIEKTFDLLECDKPLCTVSEEMIHDYSRPFVNRYGFKLSEVAKGMYRKSKLEYIFNG